MTLDQVWMDEWSCSERKGGICQAQTSHFCTKFNVVPVLLHIYRYYTYTTSLFYFILYVSLHFSFFFP